VWCISVVAQEFSLERQLPVTSKSFEVDALGNIYLLTDYNIYKLTPKGDTVVFYSAKNHGTISQLDVSIPHKPIVLFKESGKIVELDFTLTENPSPVFLFQYGIMRPNLVTHAFSNGGYWVYDAAKFELINLGKNLKINTTTGNLMLLTTLKDFNPTQLFEKDDLIYLADPNNGVLVFDVFGTYIKTHHIKAFSEIQPFGEGFIFQNPTGVRYISLLEEQLLEQLIIPEGHLQTRFKNNRIYFLSTKAISIYVPANAKNK
jgi:hypothetical protein